MPCGAKSAQRPVVKKMSFQPRDTALRVRLDAAQENTRHLGSGLNQRLPADVGCRRFNAGRAASSSRGQPFIARHEITERIDDDDVRLRAENFFLNVRAETVKDGERD